MNWQKEIPVEGKGGMKLEVTVAEIESAIIAYLTVSEQEEFLRSLMGVLS